MGCTSSEVLPDAAVTRCRCGVSADAIGGAVDDAMMSASCF